MTDEKKECSKKNRANSDNLQRTAEAVDVGYGNTEFAGLDMKIKPILDTWCMRINQFIEHRHI